MSERGMNRHEILGRLGRDPQRGVSATGRVWTRLSIATTEVWKNRDGGREERTEWHAAVCWGGAAENAARYLARGTKVYIAGPLVSWKSADGSKSGKQILVREILFLDKGRNLGASAKDAATGPEENESLPEAPPDDLVFEESDSDLGNS
jgi:single-strand DNA-binding protein